MRLVTAEQMQHIDQIAIRKLRIPRLRLMENAGQAVIKVLGSQYPDLKEEKKKIIVVCGKGNNGGDGFVVARLLFEKKVTVCIYLATKRDELKHESRINFLKCEKLGIPIHYTNKAFKRHLSSIDLVVDGLFGTGLHSKLKKSFRDLILTLNKSKKNIVSIDIPSGVHGTTGEVMGAAIQATVTVTFGLPKLGLWLPPGMDCAGKVFIENIGFPKKLLGCHPERVSAKDPELITYDYIKGLIPSRGKSTHKGSAGHGLIFAGSPGKAGAAVMTTQSAFRSGIGLVTLLTHPNVMKLIAPQVKEAFLSCHPEFLLPRHPERNPKRPNGASARRISVLQDKSAIAFGPGIGFSKDVENLLQQILRIIKVPIIIDADGLTILSEHLNWLKTAKSPVILTPHPGEMARLIHKTTTYVQKNRIKVAQEFSKKYKIYLILKGAGTIIATPEGHIAINSSGNPAMATAGMGDVLTGMILSFISQGMKLPHALNSAVFIHGWIADQWSKKYHTQRGLTASDVIQMLPRAVDYFI